MATTGKDLRLVIGSVILLLLVYSRAYSWGWFGTTVFWIIAFSLMIYAAVLGLWLIASFFAWVKDRNRETGRLWIYLITLVLLLLSIQGMR
jgi:hypothetical protein